jgi:CNT family concentrative nucleoside transporter
MITDTLLIDTVAAAIQQVPVDSIPLSNIIPENSGFTFDLVRLLRGLMGMAVLIAIAYLFSNNRKAVNWKMVGTGLLF